MVTKSPSAAARSTSLRVAKRSRRLLDLLLDVGVGDGEVLDAGLDPVVRRQRDRRPHGDLGAELEGLVVLEPGDRDLRLRERHQVVVLERLHVELGQRVVDRLVQDGATADLAVDHGRRDLALAEAGDVHLLRDPPVGRVEARLELGERDLDGQLCAGRVDALDGALHRVNSLVHAYMTVAAPRRESVGWRPIFQPTAPCTTDEMRPDVPPVTVAPCRGDRTRTCGLLLPKQAR